MDIESILGQLANVHPSLVKRVWEGCRPYESICGMISDRIVYWLTENFPELKGKVFYMDGTYIGEGTEFSGSANGTAHCWAEIRLNDNKKIIIDGSYAQFFPKDTPMEVKDRIRLTIFHPNDERQRWYRKDR